VTTARVSTVAELLAALAGADEIQIDGSLHGMPMIALRPGVTLRGGTLRFGAKGVRMSADNRLEDITILVPDHEIAIGNDTSVADLGRLTLRNVRTRGQVLILADDAVRAGHIEIEGLTVTAADVRGRPERPRGYGVEAMQGAVTLWNRQRDPAARITAHLDGVSASSAGTPVRGSGVFVGGHGGRAGRTDGGELVADLLRTGPVYSDGGIEPGTPDLISGVVFVISGARVHTVVNDGPVSTGGANDMVLDNWGTVGSWTARSPVTSHGPSGIGFVNFGVLERLDVQAPVETFGTGARGFNVYDGSVTSARFQSITTHADGAVGIQVSKDLPVLDITGSVTTYGGRGLSLVRGEQTELSAIAISVQAGGRIGRLTVGGAVSTRGDQVVTLDVEGSVGSLQVGEGIRASGAGSDAVHAAAAGAVGGLDETAITAAHGQPVVCSGRPLASKAPFSTGREAQKGRQR
jgi:hypothetical protein